MNTWKSNWPLDAWQMILVLVIVAGIVFVAYLVQRKRVSQFAPSSATAWRRTLLLLLLRLFALAVLIWMLGELTWTRFRPTSGEVWLAVDNSGSMGIVDAINEEGIKQRRIQRVANLVPKVYERIRLNDPNVIFRFFTFGESLQEVDLERISASGDQDLASSSRVQDALQSLLDRAQLEQPRAILVYTDARDTVGGSLQSVNTRISDRSSSSVVLFPVGEGVDEAAIDIVSVLPPSITFVGDSVDLTARVKASNLLGKDVQVQTVDAKSNSVVAEQSFKVVDDRSLKEAKLSFEVKQAGLQQFKIIASSGAGTQKIVDEQTLTLNVRDKPLPVLMIASTYSYEARFLKHYLERTLQRTESGKNVFAPKFCIASTDRQLVQAESSNVPYLPADEQWWKQFEACVVIDPDPQMFDQLVTDAIGKAVQEEGMGLIYVSGLTLEDTTEESVLWDKILPIYDQVAVSRQELAITFTEEAPLYGIRLQASGTESLQLPMIYSTLRKPQPKPTASVLAISGDYPFLVTQLVGYGQVIYQSSDETYRWRTYRGNEQLFNQYWTSLIGSVSKQSRTSRILPEVQVATSRDSWLVGENVELNLDLHGQGVDLTGRDFITLLLQSDELRREVRMQRTAGAEAFRGIVQLERSGSYSVSNSPDSAWLTLPIGGSIRVVERRTEETVEGPDMKGLKEFAERQSATFAKIEDWEQVIDNLPAERTLHFEPLKPQSIWNYPLLVVLVIAALGSEWYLRNRWGLL